MERAHRPSFELRLRVIHAVEHAPGDTIRARIKHVANQVFIDHKTNQSHQFTWRTIQTWLYRFKVSGITTMESKTRSDKYKPRKISIEELAEALDIVMPMLLRNKKGLIPKTVIYRKLKEQGLITTGQLAYSTFSTLVRQHELLKAENTARMRLAFAMQHANELWQADTMYGPSIVQPNGAYKKTFLIAFIDDASRLITHAEFFYADNTANMIEAFKAALFKRGKPERLYLDNGANYTSKEIMQACCRLDILLCHTPIRDGASKGKIERFFRGFRDRFLTQHPKFQSLTDLNSKTIDWIENDYNNTLHSALIMTPLERFALDIRKIQFIPDDEFTAEVFYVEEQRKVTKTNVFSIQSRQFECPVDLREKTIQVRYDRTRADRFVVFYRDQRLGQATELNLYANAKARMKQSKP